ncbi:MULTISPECIES: hypothetical protein [Streptomyces]|uniref:hypothetical protein n=1 Tax=Streptomyces TaxID=1883 RepID=UPI0006864383|nr:MULTISPECIES: hypothetical protein [Streptomyces]MCC3654777.1 hypothetical protein [Streptomyces sp. S07_1.15]MZE78666.1 hypothetical protein [Streptomyces sp. SID5475]WSQ70868.1 hypothetical protein OG463_05095 [Streptomyces xinghaiensis]
METSDVWLNTDGHFAPGRELFRSERAFSVWAYTVSHGQLLLRARSVGRDGTRQSRIDVLFKPVRAVKTGINYSGLVIRCATEEERKLILADTGHARRDDRVLVLETADGRRDHVVAGAVGWSEDWEGDHEPSRLAFLAPGTLPGRLLP